MRFSPNLEEPRRAAALTIITLGEEGCVDISV